PSLYNVVGIDRDLASTTFADIRDGERLSATIARTRPEFVFHLAAQSLVRYSYEHPVETYAVNVMGAVHLLEAVRAAASVKVVVNVTSDKCYANHESLAGYGEHDPLGGDDPYASSKAC